MMGIEKTEAIVINSRDWKETSKIVTFYTSSNGKLAAIAKGARRKNNPFRNCLQLFAYLNLVYYEKEGRELQVVSQCAELESFQDLREDLAKTAYASYFIQLVDEMVRGGEGNEELFMLLLAALYWLKEEGSSEMLARFFELHLLRVLGYNPMLRSCVVCQKAVKSPAGGLKLSPSSGGIVCERCLNGIGDCRTLSGGVYSALLHLQSVDIVKLKRLRLSHVLSEELKSAMYYYLGYFLEKRLKSQDFLERVIAPMGDGVETRERKNSG